MVGILDGRGRGDQRQRPLVGDWFLTLEPKPSILAAWLSACCSKVGNAASYRL